MFGKSFYVSIATSTLKLNPKALISPTTFSGVTISSLWDHSSWNDNSKHFLRKQLLTRRPSCMKHTKIHMNMIGKIQLQTKRTLFNTKVGSISYNQKCIRFYIFSFSRRNHHLLTKHAQHTFHRNSTHLTIKNHLFMKKSFNSN